MALVAADGSVVWKLSLGPSTAAARVAVQGDGTIYVGGSARDVNLWALDANGKELWQWHQEPWRDPRRSAGVERRCDGLESTGRHERPSAKSAANHRESPRSAP